MADIFGTVTAVAGVLEQCIGLLERINDAVQRQHELPKLIVKYTDEIKQCMGLVELIEAEEALKTPKVGEGVTKLRAISQELQTHLAKMAATKGPIRGFFKQLVSGKQDQERLDGIMKDLGATSQYLTLCIQVSNIGLTRGIDKNITANVAAVEAMSKLVTERLGPGHPLKIAQLLEGRPQNADGTVTLTKDDIAFLSTQEVVAEELKPRKSRVIRNNETYRHALQVNTPIGVDVWKDVDIITIEGNKATDGATQWNYPIASADVFIAGIQAMKGQGA